MDSWFGVRLQVVPLAEVYPHEIPDEPRLERLRQRLREDRQLRDPVMVGTLTGVAGYILLDGTNRRAALQSLGFERILVQTVDYADRHCVQLRTWCHVVTAPLDELLVGLRSMPHAVLEEVAIDGVDTALDAAGGVAVLAQRDQAWIVRRAGSHGGRPELLRDLIGLYEGRMSREARDDETIAEKLREVQRRPHMAAATLVSFPRVARTQVAQLALHGTLIPSGITRHVMRCGRALRVNLPLAVLSGDCPLPVAEELLARHLEGTTPRRYLEPTVLFDS